MFERHLVRNRVVITMLDVLGVFCEPFWTFWE